MARVTTNDLLEALRQHGTPLPRKPIGEGWYTIQELADREQATVSAIKWRIKCAKARGVIIEQATGTALDADGKPKRTAYYRLKKP